MTRRNEGEATFEALGKTWRLVFDMNVMIDFAEATGRAHLPLPEVMACINPDTMSLVELRKLFWVMLKEHHPEVTEREAGKLVQSATAALNSAMTSAMPDAAVMDAIGLQAEPEKAKATPDRVA